MGKDGGTGLLYDVAGLRSDVDVPDRPVAGVTPGEHLGAERSGRDLADSEAAETLTEAAV